MIKYHVIDFLFVVLRMGKFRSQVAIVGKQHYTGSVAVEASYGVNTFAAGIFNQIKYCQFGVCIFRGGYTVFGLIEQQVNFALRAYRLIVKHHFIGRQYFCAKFCDDFTINRNYTSLYVFVSFTTGANTGIGQKFVQSNRFIGINI